MSTYTLTTLPDTCPLCGAAINEREDYMREGHSLASLEFDCGTVIEHNPRTDKPGQMSVATPCDE